MPSKLPKRNQSYIEMSQGHKISFICPYPNICPDTGDIGCCSEKCIHDWLHFKCPVKNWYRMHYAVAPFLLWHKYCIARSPWHAQNITSFTGTSRCSLRDPMNDLGTAMAVCRHMIIKLMLYDPHWCVHIMQRHLSMKSSYLHLYVPGYGLTVAIRDSPHDTTHNISRTYLSGKSANNVFTYTPQNWFTCRSR